MPEINYIHASNGNGEAVRAVVVENRGTGNMAINVDSVLNWPQYFIATSGDLNIDTGELDPESITVFFGRLDGGTIMISDFASGYSDVGNFENQIIVLKPTTEWANEIAKYIENGGVKDHYLLEHIGVNTHDQIDTKLASLLNEREITKESTGFTNNGNIDVSYNPTTRKITLTGTFEAYYKGEKITALVDGWESQAHADVAGNYFLRYCEDDGGFAFDTAPWEFDCLQIAYVQYNGHKFALRETHSFMQWQSHKEFHDNIGTYRTAGGSMTNYVLNSTTAANRRPDISSTTVQDEDLQSTITALTSKTYTQRYLTGAAVRSFTTGASDIIALNGNIPYYNQNVAGIWQQTPMANNEYGAIFIVAIPTTSDAGSQAYRYLFVQPQQVGTLAEIQALTVGDLTHGDSANLVSEFVFIGKIIIGVSGNNWTIQSYELLTGSKLVQLTAPGGGGIATVEHDSTLLGTGTVSSPLSVNAAALPSLATQSLDKLMVGAINGVNKDFTTAANFSDILVFKTGITMHVGDDFDITGANKITMKTAPVVGDKITCITNTASTMMIQGSNSWKPQETPTGLVNGVNKTFFTSVPYVPNSLNFYENGWLQQNGVHYFETNPATGEFTTSEALATGTNILTSYQFVLSVSGNADTVDNYHASATPTANTLLPLNANGKFLTGQIKLSNLDWLDPGSTNFATTSSTFQDITGVTTSYTSGNYPETVLIWVQGMFTCGGGAAHVGFVINGVNQADEVGYNNSPGIWSKFSKLYMFNIPADTTYILKCTLKNEVSGQSATFHRGAEYRASIRGFAISQ